MTRETKFRGAADKEGGGIHLVYGDLITDCNEDCIYRDTHPDRIVWKNGGKPIRKGTRMQYTGLKDKNGVNIYESDIVEISQMAHGSKKTKVVFENFMYKFISLDDDRLWYFSDISKNMKLKIIGNIYETPNLLKN